MPQVPSPASTGPGAEAAAAPGPRGQKAAPEARAAPEVKAVHAAGAVAKDAHEAKAAHEAALVGGARAEVIVPVGECAGLEARVGPLGAEVAVPRSVWPRNPGRRAALDEVVLLLALQRPML